ncbi:unnamed protein product, partial [Allacma fusca]
MSIKRLSTAEFRRTAFTINIISNKGMEYKAASETHVAIMNIRTNQTH